MINLKLTSDAKKWIDENIKEPRLRLSYSLLNLWTTGRHEDAIKLYLHQPLPQTRAMKFGKKFHEKVAFAINTHKRMVVGNSKFEFKNPQTELKLIVPFNEKWDLSGTLDCLDEDTLYEFKSGETSSVDYANDYQVYFYFLLCELAKIPVEEAFLIHYNQFIKRADWVLVWNGEGQKEEARNYIESLAPEISDFFEKNNIPLDK